MSNTHQIKYQTLIIISDRPKHDAVAVYVFLESLNEYLSQNYPQIHKCIYFSDGAPQQFENVKHFSTIHFHKTDFHRSAVWHFHATTHGKGPCDGASGTIKRMALRASLQRISGDQISSAFRILRMGKQRFFFAQYFSLV